MPVFENARFITCEAEGEVFPRMAVGSDGRMTCPPSMLPCRVWT